MEAKIILDSPVLDFSGKELNADLTSEAVLDAVNQTLREEFGTSPEKLLVVETAIEKRLESHKKNFTAREALYTIATVSMGDSSPEEFEVLFNTAAACIGKNELELENAEQLAILKKAIFKVYKSALVNQQLFAFLEGKNPLAILNKQK